MPKWKIPVAILSWIIPLLIKLILSILGLVVVGWFGKDPQLWWPKWTKVWQNNEIRGSDFELQFNWWERWVYMATRNPANNMRYWFRDPVTYKTWGYTGQLESLPMKEAAVQKASRWRQAKWMFSYRKLTLLDDQKYFEFYIGWKIGMDVPGIGITFQARRGNIGN